MTCFALFLAACPTGKGSSDGEATAGSTGATADSTGTGPISTTGTTNDSAVTDSSATQDTASCQPIACDDCAEGCIGSSFCDGPVSLCECACETVSTSDGHTTGAGESTSTPGTSTTTTDTSDTTGTTGTTDTTGTTGTTGEPAIACGGDAPFFPEFDRACAEPADCALVFHQIDCCGSLAALGISGDAAKLFAEAEAECTMQYPQCDCPAQPTVADDGSGTPDNNTIEVTCLDAQCLSFVP